MKEDPRVVQPPPLLAVANIHPDHLDICFEEHATGSRHPCKLPKGTITVIRRTSGGRPRTYGALGLWYYTGDCQERRRARWPTRWSWRLAFEPLVLRFEDVFCEDFAKGRQVEGQRESPYVPGLAQCLLQGAIVPLRPASVAASYLAALLGARRTEMERSVDYLGETVDLPVLLERLRATLK